VSPRNALEASIEKIWRTHLKCDSAISVLASFFNVGGDSLKAGQIVSIMRKELNVPLSVADLFEYPSIADLALKLGTSEGEVRKTIDVGRGLSSSKDTYDSYEFSTNQSSTSFWVVIIQVQALSSLSPPASPTGAFSSTLFQLTLHFHPFFHSLYLCCYYDLYCFSPLF